MSRIDVNHISRVTKELAFQALHRISPSDPVYKVARRRSIRPVDYMRCAEFYAILKDLTIKPRMRILDVSSPQWFSLFLAREYPETQFDYINIIESEIAPYRKICRLCGIKNLTYHQEDVRSLTFGSEMFDKVISISVIEHVYPEVGGDYRAMQELNRVLKYDGEIMLTLPYKSKRNIVYFDGAVYERGPKKSNFYAREYDEEMFTALVEGSAFYVKNAYFITERLGLFSLDYYEWGPGKRVPFARYLIRKRGILERLLRKSFDELLAKHYLRVSPQIDYRLVNIAATLGIKE